jgi:hypothetical protein
MSGDCKEGGEPRTQGRRPGESDKTMPGILRPLLVLPLEQIDADRVRVWLKDETDAPPDLRPPCLRPAARLPELVQRSPRVPRPSTVLTLASRAWPATNSRRKPPRTIAYSVSNCRHGSLPCARSVIPLIAAYLQTALLTGARREEVAGIRWEDVDFQWKSMTIKDKVEGTAHDPADALRRRRCWPACRVAMNGCSQALPRHLEASGAAHHAQQGIDRCRAAGVVDSRPAPFLWYACRMGGMPRGSLGANHGAQAKRDR